MDHGLTFFSLVYPEAGFTALVIVSFLWLFMGLFLVGIYPMWEARKSIVKIFNNFRADLRPRHETE